jgi:hypothetical protein
MTNYNWTLATGNDVPDIVNMAESHFQTEIDTIFTPDPIAYARNITLAIVNQFYLPTTSIVSIAKQDNKLLAYTWASSDEKAPWSDDKMIVIRMAHVNLTLPIRDRIKLVQDMFTVWENFAILAQVPIICSTTMRKDQSGFLKLHEKNGYDVRGSYAYKKIDTTQATPAN